MTEASVPVTNQHTRHGDQGVQRSRPGHHRCLDAAVAGHRKPPQGPSTDPGRDEWRSTMTHLCATALPGDVDSGSQCRIVLVGRSGR